METNKVYLGDCIDIMRGLPKCSVDLVFADPPFNIGLKYDNYNDNKSYEEYYKWSEKWIDETYRVLKQTGSIYIAIGDEFAAEIKAILKKIGFLEDRDVALVGHADGHVVISGLAGGAVHVVGDGGLRRGLDLHVLEHFAGLEIAYANVGLVDGLIDMVGGPEHVVRVVDVNAGVVGRMGLGVADVDLGKFVQVDRVGGGRVDGYIGHGEMAAHGGDVKGGRVGARLGRRHGLGRGLGFHLGRRLGVHILDGANGSQSHESGSHATQ